VHAFVFPANLKGISIHKFMCFCTAPPCTPGFVSGTLTISPTCGDAPARGCELCQSSSNIPACLACVKEVSQDPASLAIRGDFNARLKQDACPQCISASNRSPEQCVACLKDDSLPCNFCPMKVRKETRRGEKGVDYHLCAGEVNNWQPGMSLLS
jgi:hypothetical protein